MLIAYRRASKGKRGHPDVAAFEHRLEDNLLDIGRDLCAKIYRPQGYVSFVIHEPKRRLISAAPFRDRVVHHALCNVIEPLLDRTFIEHSYANRIGKGTHRALDACHRLARQYGYVLSCDIRQFFPSIDHAILRTILRRTIDDLDVLWLVDRILDSGAHLPQEECHMVSSDGDDLLAAARPRGLPIGNLTSQLWGNCYLNPLDHFVKRGLRCRGYVRYLDDFILFGDEKAVLWEWLGALTDWLAELRLAAHPSAQPRPTREGIPFLGFVVYPWARRLRRQKGVRFARRFRALARRYAAGEISLSRLTAVAQGWANHARYGNTVGLRRAVLGGTAI